MHYFANIINILAVTAHQTKKVLISAYVVYFRIWSRFQIYNCLMTIMIKRNQQQLQTRFHVVFM
jgi:hypothetical protein